MKINLENFNHCTPLLLIFGNIEIDSQHRKICYSSEIQHSDGFTVREERIVQAAAYWNRKKLASLPQSLYAQLTSASKRYRAAKLKLEIMMSDKKISEDEIEDFIKTIQGNNLGKLAYNLKYSIITVLQ